MLSSKDFSAELGRRLGRDLLQHPGVDELAGLDSLELVEMLVVIEDLARATVVPSQPPRVQTHDDAYGYYRSLLAANEANQTAY
jgi:hypothetical protein